MKKTILLSISFLFASAAFAQEEPMTSGDGLASWGKIYEVLSHPRCANCHVGEDNRPRWSGAHYGLEEGEWRFHGMFIHADETRIGAETLMCATCHQQENSPVPHGPPGAPAWTLAPVEMEWFGKSSAQVCQQIKDPERNGDRSLDEIADHIDHDGLVHWGWAPGLGREPAPYSKEDMVADVVAWANAGAPCPQ